MRCKVPAASRPRGLRATHAPPRRPEVTPAAHTDRMLQTPPDIATRSQSAGRSVNPPPPPLAGTGPAGAQPPSSGASPGGLAASTQLGSASPLGTPSPASPGGLQNRGLGLWGQLRAFCPTDWGNACLGARLSGKLIPLDGSRSAGGLRPFLQVSADASSPPQSLPTS